MYCSVLGVSCDRVTYANKQKNDEGINLLDKRGKREPGNKISHETIENVQSFFDEFQKFRSDDSKDSTLCFSPDLSITKLYRLYCEKNGDQHKLGKTIFRKCLKDYEERIEIASNSYMSADFNLCPSEKKKTEDEKEETVSRPLEWNDMIGATPSMKKRRLATALRQSGQTYIRRNGKVCEKIEFEYLKCSCQFDCKYLSIEARRKIFDHFWQLGNWDDQTAFICSTVQQVTFFYKYFNAKKL